MFEHTVTYLPVQYYPGRERGLVFKHRGPEIYPEPASLWDNPDYEQYFALMGQEGWQLVSVRPLLRGEPGKVQDTDGSLYGIGPSITAGYYFFWKRSTPT